MTTNLIGGIGAIGGSASAAWPTYPPMPTDDTDYVSLRAPLTQEIAQCAS